MAYILPVITVLGYYNISSKLNNKLNLNLDNFYFAIFSFLLFLGFVVILITFKIDLNFASVPILLILHISFFNFVYLNLNKIFSFLKKEKIVSLFLIFFAILTLVPLAGADSYAYHLAWPQDLIENPKVMFNQLFLESRVVGIGEIINFVGLILGTENLLSFLSFTVLCTFVFKIKEDKRIFVVLILMSTPMIYKYLLDQKPFILPCLFLIIFIENFFNKIFLKKVTNFDFFAFFVALSFFANTKYPFLCIAFFIYLFFLYTSYKENFHIKFIIIGLIVFIFHFIPIPLMKFIYFGDPFSPFLEGIINKPDQEILMLKEMYRNWDGFKIVSNDSNYFLTFIRNLFNFVIPIKPFTLLDTMGIVVFIFAFFKYEEKKKLFFIIYIFIITSSMVLYTNFQSRWYLFLFLYVILSFDSISISPKLTNYLKKILLIFSFLMMVFHYFYIAHVVKNSLLINFENVLKNRAYLYEEINEVKNISQENYTLTNTRGNFFYKNLIQFKYPNFSTKQLLKNKNIHKVKYGFFSTGTSKLNNSELYSETILSNFNPDCFEIIYNKLNLVAKRNIFSSKDYENFVFVKFIKPIKNCLK